MNDILVSIQDFIPQDRLLYCPDPEMGERLFYLKSPSYTQPTYQVSTNDPIAVSYTHLDVYKRQSLGRMTVMTDTLGYATHYTYDALSLIHI